MAAKLLFLLDENIICRVVNAEQIPPVLLWQTIWKNCHKVLISPSLYEKYWQHVRNRRRSLEGSDIVAGFLGVLNLTLRTDEKTVPVEDRDWAPRRDLRLRHPADWYMVSLIEQVPAGMECIYVADDRQTREDFEALGKERGFNVRSATIEEALVLAQRPSG